MNFWETIRGVRLADTLTRELPKLTDEKRQFVVNAYGFDHLNDVIHKKLEKGNSLVTVISKDENYIVVFAR